MGDAQDSAVEQRVIALAEQLGRFIGTVQRKADGWLDRKKLNDEVTRIRDEASSLLEQIAAVASPAEERPGSEGKKRSADAARPRGRSGGTVDAPRKAHRKRPPSAKGAKHSDSRIAKIAGAKTMRRGQRRG